MGKMANVGELKDMVGGIALARHNLTYALILWVRLKQIAFSDCGLPGSNAGGQNPVEGIRRLRKERIAQRVVTVGELIDVQSRTCETTGEYPGVIEEPADLVAMLPTLTPRLYSISSSLLAHQRQIHTTVAVVRYRSYNRERGGVCSTFFADRSTLSDRLPIYIQPNKKFKLPKNFDAPIIMIGPGTGIAPFRGFLHERRALGAKGRNWLFFGERSAATDYLYREELESMRADGHLTRLDTAFSPDQEDKIYVQDRMMEHVPLFWSWLEDGASVYVCGDATRMAKDVHAALYRIVEKEGGMPPQAAEEYIHALRDAHRYHRDVY